jgi:uncharacterized protein YjbJ (UPF0337 family)
MNKDEIKGVAQNIKGRVKEALGSLTGDKKVQAEGTAERVQGAAEKKVSEVKKDLNIEEESDESLEEDINED